MSFWMLAQVLLFLLIGAGFVLVWIKLNRPQKDDPRLSKGLQLLQNKIAVLEDLSDRTETQVHQLTSLMEAKIREIQSKVEAADKMIADIDRSMKKSMEVAKIFQDKIPHEEIIERQNTIKFVKAAKMAHTGASVDEIASQVDLSRGEIEFITKVNKHQLTFDEGQLPGWANDSELSRAQKPTVSSQTHTPPQAQAQPQHFGQSMAHTNQPKFQAGGLGFTESQDVFSPPRADMQALKKLGEEFRKVTREQEENAKPKIKKVQFPRI